jgi:hypothetical protein
LGAGGDRAGHATNVTQRDNAGLLPLVP